MTTTMLSVAEASQRVRARVRQLDSETVALDEARGRFLAVDVQASRSLPPWDNSAMDGFAIRAEDVPATLPIAGVVAAGAAPDAIALRPGTAVRIMTGAPVPPGADAVVMREDVEDRGATAVFAQAAARGEHVRRAGEDIAAGELALPAGECVGPAEIGLLAAIGCARVEVRRQPRVAILSSGDELVELGQSPGPGQIINSNAHALAAQVREAGGQPTLLGIANDTQESLVDRLRRGMDADVLVTSGGVSVGDYDFVKPALEAVGIEPDFWKVAMKPGKPVVFGVGAGGVLVFGLPGNPVSSMVAFELFVRPALLLAQGARDVDRPRVPVALERAYRKQRGRAHYVRASLRRDGARLWAEPNPRQGSGMLRSMTGVDALIEIAAELGDQAAGAELTALLLRAR